MRHPHRPGPYQRVLRPHRPTPRPHPNLATFFANSDINSPLRDPRSLAHFQKYGAFAPFLSEAPALALRPRRMEQCARLFVRIYLRSSRCGGRR
ncbi:hypothetical protein MTP99_014010 [Tenebrio molitor]|nr:hypothetical protein MTP99_014010 [Tenebrio molitor]